MEAYKWEMLVIGCFAVVVSAVSQYRSGQPKIAMWDMFCAGVLFACSVSAFVK